MEPVQEGYGEHMASEQERWSDGVQEEEECFTGKEMKVMVKKMVQKELKNHQEIIAGLEHRVNIWETWGTNLENRLVAIMGMVETLHALVEHQLQQPLDLGTGPLRTHSPNRGAFATGTLGSSTLESTRHDTHVVGSGLGTNSFGAPPLASNVVRYQVNGLDVEMSPPRPRELQ